MIKNFSIIIPAYNEEKRIKNSLIKLKNYLVKQNAENYEVIIVNDGSKDRTDKILEEFKTEPNFKIISYKRNRGKGYACRKGAMAAKKEFILLMDADLATSLKEISNFSQFAKSHPSIDVMIGSRKIGQNASRTLPRKIISWIFHTISHIFVNVGVKDTQCGFKLFRKEAAKMIFPKARMDRWLLDVEILFLAKKYCLNIKELPVIWQEMGGSTVRFFSTSTNMIKSLFQIRINNLRGFYNFEESVLVKRFNLRNLITIILLFTVFFTVYNHARVSYSGSNDKPSLVKQGIQIKSIDTQIVSKHWTSPSRESIHDQLLLIKDLGANYVAISTPYDKPEEIKIWSEEAHKIGLHVWFRSHWLNWEGDEGALADMTAEEYIRNTSNFIKENASIFLPEDSFTMAVEPEQAGVGQGKKFESWDVYNQFIVDQIEVATKAFASINLGGKIHTNWISMNGWIVMNDLKPGTVEKLGLITVDHYPDQDPNLPPAVIASNFARDLEEMYQKWHKPILIGEWGYNTQEEVDDYKQKSVIQNIIEAIDGKSYIVGLNYWDHMGNTSRLINDEEGKKLSYRQSALVIKDFYLKR